MGFFGLLLLAVGFGMLLGGSVVGLFVMAGGLVLAGLGKALATQRR